MLYKSRMMKPGKTQVYSLKNKSNPHRKLLSMYAYPEQLLSACWDHIDHNTVSSHQVLSEDFMRNHAEELDWSSLSASQFMSDDFIHEFKDKIQFMPLIRTRKVSEAILEEIIAEGRLDVNSVIWAQHKHVSEDFIRKHRSKISIAYWEYVCFRDGANRLSESFMCDHIDYLSWQTVAGYQKFSYDFAIEHVDKLPWNLLVFRKHALQFTEEQWDSLEVACKLVQPPEYLRIR